MRMTSPFVLGIVGGVMFFAHGMINNSHAWPLIWPALAGLAVVVQARRNGDAGFGSELLKAAKVGMFAALVFLGATAVTLGGMGLLRGSTLLALALAATLGIIASLLAGSLAYPLTHRGS